MRSWTPLQICKSSETFQLAGDGYAAVAAASNLYIVNMETLGESVLSCYVLMILFV